MDALNFYHCLSLLLNRGGFASDLQSDAIDAENPEEKARRKWMDRTLETLEHLTDAEFNSYSRFHLDLERLDEGLKQNIIKDWNAFKQDFPIAGLRFSKGRASTFIAKIMDHESLDNMETFYRQKDREFRDFADNYTLALARNANTVITFCFGFQDEEKLQKAREHLKGVKLNKMFFTVNYSELWFFDLKNERLHIPEGFAGKSRSVADSLTHKWGKRLSFNQQEEKLENWSHKGGMFTMSTIGPATFREFLQLYKQAVGKGKVSMPPEFLAQMEAETSRFEKVKHQLRLEKIESEIQGLFKKMGEMLLQQGEPDGELDMLKEDFQSALACKQEIAQWEKKVEKLGKHQKDWKGSLENETKLETEKSTLEEKFKELSKDFGKGLFEKDKSFILADSALMADFSNLLGLEKNIEDRKNEISELKAKGGNFIQQAKSQTRMLYLKGLNEKDQWEKRKYWTTSGEQAFSHIQNLPQTSHNIALWGTMKNNREQLKRVQAGLSTEKQRQKKWETAVRKLFPDLEKDSYPWQKIQDSAQSQINKLTGFQEIRLIRMGEKYRDHVPSSDKLQHEQMMKIQALEQERKEIEQEISP